MRSGGHLISIPSHTALPPGTGRAQTHCSWQGAAHPVCKSSVTLWFTTAYISLVPKTYSNEKITSWATKTAVGSVCTAAHAGRHKHPARHQLQDSWAGCSSAASLRATRLTWAWACVLLHEGEWHKRSSNDNWAAPLWAVVTAVQTQPSKSCLCSRAGSREQKQKEADANPQLMPKFHFQNDLVGCSLPGFPGRHTNCSTVP